MIRCQHIPDWIEREYTMTRLFSQNCQVAAFFGTLGIIFLLTSTHAAEPSTSPQPRTLVKKVADAVLRDYKKTPHFDWGQGVLMSGMMRAYQLTGDERYLDFVHNFVDRWHERGIGPLLEKRGYCGHWGPGYALLMFHEAAKDKRSMELVEEINQFMIQKAERTADGGLSHFDDKPQLWVDTLDMCCPVLSHSSRILNQTELQQESVRQLEVFAKYLQDPETGLFYHMWDEKKAKHTPGFWGRGNGWVVMAYTEALKYEKPGSSAKCRLEKAFKKQLTSIVKLQDKKTGLWHTVLDAPKTYLETSGSAMILYGMAECRKLNLIEMPYDCAMHKAWEGLARQVDAKGRVVGVSEATGPAGPSYYSKRKVGTYDWGTGAWLMAACAYEEYKQSCR